MNKEQTSTKPTIGIVGRFQNGKSTLVNCLLGCQAAETGGRGLRTTRINATYSHAKTQKMIYKHRGKKVKESRKLRMNLAAIETNVEFDEIEMMLDSPILEKINIIDTPGFDADEHDDESAARAMKYMDCAIVVLRNSAISKPELAIFEALHKEKIPTFVLMNCYPEQGKAWHPDSEYNKEKLKEISAKISNENLRLFELGSSPIFACNLQWYWFSSLHDELAQNEDFQTMEYNIEKFFKRTLKEENVSISRIEHESAFEEVRKAFTSDSDFGFPLLAIRWQRTLNKCLLDWTKSYFTRIEKIKF